MANNLPIKEKDIWYRNKNEKEKLMVTKFSSQFYMFFILWLKGLQQQQQCISAGHPHYCLRDSSLRSLVFNVFPARGNKGTWVARATRLAGQNARTRKNVCGARWRFCCKFAAAKDSPGMRATQDL
jgi:hypothetical protein